MLQYFLRRLLLVIPTFLGATLIVFFIVQLAPGGPLEQQITALKMGSGGEGGSGKGDVGALPESALRELKRYYGFDKPIYIRYFMWLGVYPRAAEDFPVTVGSPRNVGGGERLLVEKEGNGYKLYNADDRTKPVSGWEVEEVKDEKGETEVRVVKREFSGILTADFGKSYEFREPVIDLIADRMHVSLQFGLIGFILSYTVCVYMGIQKAVRHGSGFDIASSVIVFIGYSIPGWALGFLLLVLLGGGSALNIFPLGGFQSPDYDTMSIGGKILDRAYYAVLPIIAYTINSFASLMMLMKNSLLENLSQDYARTAFAKGLSEKRVIWIHAMRNSIIPLAANIGYVIGIFVASSYLVELAFNINGIGKLSLQAVFTRDYPIVFAFTVISVLINLIGAILSDLALATVDPRIRFK